MNSRNELKFIANLPFNYSIEKFIKMNPGHFSEIYESRFINNIYFDNLNFKNYFDTINGISKRKKIRLRWYGDFFGLIDNSVLEIKKKNGKVVSKIQHDFPPFKVELSTNIENIIDNISLGSNFFFMKNKSPSIINRYERKYFLLNNKKFRITIDKNQEFSNPKNVKKPKKMYPFLSHIIVVELKFDVKWEKEAMEITNAFPFRVNKNSKYVNALKALHAIK